MQSSGKDKPVSGSSRKRKRDDALDSSSPDDVSSSTSFKKSKAEPSQSLGSYLDKDSAPEDGSNPSMISAADLDDFSSEPLPSRIDAFGIQPTPAALQAGLRRLSKHKRNGNDKQQKFGGVHRKKLRIKEDFFGRLAEYPEIIMDLALALPLPAFKSLYAISKDFNETINGHLSHIMKRYAACHAPESSRVYVFHVYSSLCILDPVGRLRPDTSEIRMVPCLRWLQMVVHREKTVRDILACMARQGHRMPRSTSLTVKKMWLTMDIATCAGRASLMHNEEYWTNQDLYNACLFMTKLDMRFNDPIDGPGDDGLKKLMLGQKGLTPLGHLLKRTRFTSNLEVIRLAVRYAHTSKEEHSHLPIFGVPANAVGKGHLEGWGAGIIHLWRMDELVPRESVRRNLGLENHILMMVLWGAVDQVTKKNIEVSEEEMYMSDDERDDQVVGAGWTGLDQSSDGVNPAHDWETDEEDEDEDEKEKEDDNDNDYSASLRQYDDGYGPSEGIDLDIEGEDDKLAEA